MTASKPDPALYYLPDDGKLIALSGSYVDDILRTGNGLFRNKTANKTKNASEMTEDSTLPIEFTGFAVKKDQDGELILDQHHFLRKLECLPPNASLNRFRSMRMRLAWLINSRPDFLFDIAKIAQVIEDMFYERPKHYIGQLKKVIKYATDNFTTVKILKLDMESLQIVGFSDASFVNNYDLSSQHGYVILLVNDTNQAAPIVFRSYKARRVTRYVMPGKIIAFSYKFNYAIDLTNELSQMLKKRIPLQLLTDSKCLFDVISKGSRTSEKRMILDTAAAREGIKEGVASDIGFIRSSTNIKFEVESLIKFVIVWPLYPYSFFHCALHCAVESC